jgi:hypothetical protein
MQVLQRAKEKINTPIFMMPESLASTDTSLESALTKFKHESVITLDH